MRDHDIDHGGNLDQAMARFGAGDGGAGDWVDLSTGINRRPWPWPDLLPDLPAAHWRNLPTRAAQEALVAQAAASWGLAPGAAGLALAGAQAAIQLVPRLRPRGQAAVLGPTYNEHSLCLQAEGWTLCPARELEALAGADLAIVVNPNNPDGRSFAPDRLRALSESVGFLVVDESFGDVTPEQSLLPQLGPENLLVLRSFGKFYGLAGLRLGFAFGAKPAIAALGRMVGPWPVSGPAIEIGRRALADTAWAAAMREQLRADAARADNLARQAGWQLVGGCTLFRLYDTGNAAQAQTHLAQHKIWSRVFPWSQTLLRLGLPGTEGEWDRLAAALSAS